MKRIVLMIAALLVMASAFSQEAGPSPVLPQTDPNAVDIQPGARSCPLCMAKVQQIFQSQLVPLADGGVLLLTAGKMYKYDQNLNLVAETEVQIDYNQIRTQLQDMMSNCPICRQGLQTEGLTNGQTNGQTNGVKQKSEKPEVKTKIPKE